MGLVEPRAVDFGIGRFAVEDDSPVSDDRVLCEYIVRGRIRGRCRPLYVPPPGSRSAIGDFPAGASAPGPGGWIVQIRSRSSGSVGRKSRLSV